MTTVSQADIDRAVALLQAGALIGIPTENVYGLAADAANPEAVAKIFAAKGRPANHPLIVHLADASYLEDWAMDIPGEAWELAEAFWPGPLTLILKKTPRVPDAVTGGQDTVGIRIPAHPVTQALLRAFAAAGGSGGVAAPSANRFGRISPTEAAHVISELGDRVAMVLDGGACRVGIESTIIDLSRGEPHLLRPGHITPEQIAAVIGVLPQRPDAASPRASGTLPGHYAPRTALRILAPERLLDYLNVVRHRGGRCAVLAHSHPPQAGMPHFWRMLPITPEGYARDLYGALRAADESGAEEIVVEAIPTGPDWTAVADRLRRAAFGAGQGR